jgi:hypothetical protein
MEVKWPQINKAEKNARWITPLVEKEKSRRRAGQRELAKDMARQIRRYGRAKHLVGKLSAADTSEGAGIIFESEHLCAM